MTRAVLLALLLASACASDPRMPGPIAHRPLIAEPGSGLVGVRAGLDVVDVAPDLGAALEIGLADGLALQFPATLAYGGALTETLSLALLGGLTDAVLRPGSWAVDAPADPRRPVPSVHNTGLGFGGGLVGQWRALPDLRLRVASTASAFLYGFAHASLIVDSRLDLTHSFADTVSVSAEVGHRLRGYPAGNSDFHDGLLLLGGSVALHLGASDLSVHVGGRMFSDVGMDELVLQLGYTGRF